MIHPGLQGVFHSSKTSSSGQRAISNQRGAMHPVILPAARTAGPPLSRFFLQFVFQFAERS
jgi:hypothetical protein